MDAYEIQNPSALVEVTKGADYSTGKLFDEADCDGEAAALLAGASEKIEFAVRCLSARAVCVLLARTRRLPTALGGRQASCQVHGEAAHGETAA
jgi:hypothetical protein